MRHHGEFKRRGLLAMHASFVGMSFGVEEPCRDFELRGNVAIVTIDGPLTAKSEWFWDSYEKIVRRVGAAIESSAATVVLRIDSPGGDAQGCCETARELRAQAAAAGKRLVAYADGLAASAGYALACAAAEIYLPPTSFVGSIGCISTLLDVVEMDRSFGMNFAVVSSGARKRYGHPHVPISDAAVGEQQRQVDQLAGLFFTLVSEARPLDPAAVEKLDGGLLIASEAVTAGLADGVLTFEELIARLSGDGTGNSESPRGGTETVMGWKEDMKKAADQGDEDAKKALKAIDGDGEEDDEKGPESKKSEEGEDDKKAEDSKDDDEKKDDEEKPAKAARASARSAPKELSLAASVQSLTAWKEGQEKRELIASRPDLAASVTAWLADQPIETIKSALAALPRGTSAKSQVSAARAAVAVGTPAIVRQQAETMAAEQAEPEDQPSRDMRDIDRAMGLAPAKPIFSQIGTKSSMRVCTPAEARAEMSRREAAEAIKKGAAR